MLKTQSPSTQLLLTKLKGKKEALAFKFSAGNKEGQVLRVKHLNTRSFVNV